MLFNYRAALQPGYQVPGLTSAPGHRSRDDGSVMVCLVWQEKVGIKGHHDTMNIILFIRVKEETTMIKIAIVVSCLKITSSKISFSLFNLLYI